MKKKVLLISTAIVLFMLSIVLITNAIEPLKPKEIQLETPPCSDIVACDPSSFGVCILMTCEAHPYEPLEGIN